MPAIIVNLNSGTYHNKDHLSERCNTDDIARKAEFTSTGLSLDEHLRPTTDKWVGGRRIKPCWWCIGRYP